MSSTVQFFRISPNLLPEKRPSTSPPRSRARMRLADFGDHGVRDVEAEGVVDARQMIDADQHEGAGRAEARGFLDRLGQRGDQMGAVEFAGQRIVPRQLQQLLVAGVALVVDADDALRARRPAVGAGEPAAGFLDPDHGRGGRGPHAIFDPVGRRPRRRAPAANGRARRSGSSAPARSAWQTPRRSPAPPAEYRERPRRHCRSRRWRRLAMSQTKAAWPSEARMVGGLRDSGHQGRLVSGHCRVIPGQPEDSGVFRHRTARQSS